MTESPEPRRAVLMFPYYYPPCMCWPTASMRAEGLARGLTGLGWQAIIVTRANGCACLEGAEGDGRLEVSEPGEMEIRRIAVRPSFIWRVKGAAERLARSRFPMFGVVLRKLADRARRLTERRNDWTKCALADGEVLMRTLHVSAIWTTSVPYRTIEIGRELQHRHGTTWVADLRDSIARDRSWGGRIERMAGLHMRRRWFDSLRVASAITAVSPQEAAIDARALGRQVICVPSGFDREAWETARGEGARGQHDRGFVILYTGAFFGNRLEPADVFLSGLRVFRDRTPDAAVSLMYLGHHGNRFLAYAIGHGCGDIAVDGGFVPPQDARIAMTRADLLLLLPPITPDGGMPGGKLYEYLAAGPPILAVPGADQFVMQVIAESDAGDGASTVDTVAEALARRYEDWLRERVRIRRLDDLAEFTWAARAARLTPLLAPSSGEGEIGLSTGPLLRGKTA